MTDAERLEMIAAKEREICSRHEMMRRWVRMYGRAAREREAIKAERDAAVAALAALQRIIDAARAWSAADVVDDSPEGTRLLDEVIAYEAGPPLPARAQALLRVVKAAREYRQAEQDGTPRIIRGKALHDLGVALSDALADLDGTSGDGGS